LSKQESPAIPIESIVSKIFLVRGHRAILDSDLAILYAVENKKLIQAVKRNIERFPEDFMF
jgi:ORF6N domain